MRAALGASALSGAKKLLSEALCSADICLRRDVLAYFALKVVVALIPAGRLARSVVIRINTPIL